MFTESDVDCSLGENVVDVWLVGKVVLLGEFDCPFDCLLLREDMVAGFRVAFFVPPATFFGAAVREPGFVDVDAPDFFVPLFREVVLIDPVAEGTGLGIVPGSDGIGIKHCLRFRMRQVVRARMIAMM